MERQVWHSSVCAGSVAAGEVLNGSTPPLPCGVFDL